MKEKENIFADSHKFPKGNPFEVPEGYFEMLEDRIEARIEDEETIKTSRQKVIQLVKPLLGLAASFALAILLIYYPISRIVPWYTARQEQNENFSGEEEFITNSTFIDDNMFFQVLTTPENNHELNSDEIINYLSDELNDYEIYAEIIN